MNFNCTLLSGNLGHDPEFRFTPNGTAVCEFSVAHNEVRRNGDDLIETVHWVRVVAFGTTARTVAEHRKRGDEVILQGRLTYSEWTTEDGTKRNALNLTADKIKFGAKARTGSDNDVDTDSETG